MKLSVSQREEFDRWGLLRLPHAIPPAEAAQLHDLVWEQLSREHGIERDQPDSWTIERPQGFKAISRSELFSRTGVGPIGDAADDLMGEGRWQPAKNWRPFVTFPVPGVSWDVPVSGWHYDMPFDPEHTKGLPAINVFAFLAPVLPAGGGTLVLAGSHHLVRSYTASHPEGGQIHSPTMKAALGSAHPWLNELWTKGSGIDRSRRYLRDGAVIEGIPLRVVELTGVPGDAFLMNSLLLHAPAPNSQPTPRMMLIQMISRNRDIT